MRHRSHLRGAAAVTVLSLLAAVAVSAPARASSTVEAQPPTLITVDATGNQGTVSRAALGHVYAWEFAGLGSFNTQANGFYGKFLHQVKEVIQPGSLRWPGGTEADFFHWQRAIGPPAQRTPNAYGPTLGPTPSSVGPDEFGQLLDTTHAAGVVPTNFGTGSAAEAADLVAYMTGAPGSSQWADMRVRNGHAQPYNVPYWEVGNEETSARDWRSGTPMTVGGPPDACHKVATCLYIYGGSTQFTGQPVVGYADRTPAAADSTGAANQARYVAYPPVTPGSATVYVDGTAWTQTADLADAAPADRVYALDPATGKITFGDGTHGAIPAAGAPVTASYVSGPHDGFLGYYQAMKAVNPNIKVCSATNNDSSSDFIASMGSSLPYDCLEYHQYVAKWRVANSTPITEYQNDIMSVADTEAQEAASQQASIRAHAGHDLPLAATEYGQLLSSNPDGYPYFHDSLDEALLNASELASFIRLGIPVADRQLLTAEIPPPDKCCTSLPGNAPYATTEAIGTPGPDTVLEATGLAYKLFAPLGGGTALPVQATDNPVLTGKTQVLSLLAVRTPNYLYLVGINRSTVDPVDARVQLQGAQAGQPALVSTLNGPSSLSYNTPAAPETVRLSTGDLPAAGSDFAITFPAHSVISVRLPL
jgi:alpha-N-arabinofuranosidase